MNKKPLIARWQTSSYVLISAIFMDLQLGFISRFVCCVMGALNCKLYMFWMLLYGSSRWKTVLIELNFMKSAKNDDDDDCQLKLWVLQSFFCIFVVRISHMEINIKYALLRFLYTHTPYIGWIWIWICMVGDYLTLPHQYGTLLKWFSLQKKYYRINCTIKQQTQTHTYLQYI